jgi:3' terminal RNA ribose 2'-O-methyltransferase Hen1
MFISMTTTYVPATDLGYLLHKHPDKMHKRTSSQSVNYCFFSEASVERCTVNLVLDIGLSHSYGFSKERPKPNYNPHVNDRPYVAGSIMSVALNDMFRSAFNGQSKEKPELSRTEIPLEISIATVSCADGEAFIRGIFEPLGYQVDISGFQYDEEFPEWGQSPYFVLNLKANKQISVVLKQLYVLLPVLDDSKHYWIEMTEKDRLLKMGEGWLASHPLVEVITKRALKHLGSLSSEALNQLGHIEPLLMKKASNEESLEKTVGINDLRMQRVLEILEQENVNSVIDCGCGEGKLIEKLLGETRIPLIKGFDVGLESLEAAKRRIDHGSKEARVQLIHGSLVYLDDRLLGSEAIVLMEVIEHIDPSRLETMEKNIFGFVGSPLVVVTTPNFEYNQKFAIRGFRHPDHRFEWTRSQFSNWCQGIGSRFKYSFDIQFVGAEDQALGSPTQIGVFKKWK